MPGHIFNILCEIGRIMKLLIQTLAAAFLAVVPHAAAADAGDEGHLARIDGFVAESLAGLGVPGAAVAVVANGKTVYRKGFGHTGTAADAPLAAPEMLFGTGSVGKTFTSALVLGLADDGLIDLDAPVIRYLPELRLPDEKSTRAVTVRDLLTMRSGLGPRGPADLPSQWRLRRIAHGGDGNAPDCPSRRPYRHRLDLFQHRLHAARPGRRSGNRHGLRRGDAHARLPAARNDRNHL